jgi:hypothetical protein
MRKTYQIKPSRVDHFNAVMSKTFAAALKKLPYPQDFETAQIDDKIRGMSLEWESSTPYKELFNFQCQIERVTLFIWLHVQEGSVIFDGQINMPSINYRADAAVRYAEILTEMSGSLKIITDTFHSVATFCQEDQEDPQ